MLKTFRFLLALGCAAAVLAARPAHASLTWLGVSQTAAFGGVLDDVAYDDKHDVYLHVWEAIGDRNVYGRFIGGDGAPKGAAFVISAAKQTFAGCPKVAYSTGTDDDVFFVGFSSDFAAADHKNVFGQMVRYTATGTTGGTLVGGNFPVSPFSMTPTIFQTMNDVVFNSTQRQFFAVWDDSRGGTDVFGRQFDVNGTPVSAEINISNAPWSQGAASVAFDNEHNRYFVAYQGLDPASPANVEITGAWGKILDGATGSPITGLLHLQDGGAPIELNVVYLPNKDAFLPYWTAFLGDGRHVMGRQVPYNFEAVNAYSTGVYPVMSSAGEGGADGAYNAATGTTLVTSMHLSGRIRGAELDANGAITTPSFTISTILQRSGSFTPRVTAGGNGVFGFVYGVDFNSTWLERYQAVVTGGTPTPTPTPIPPAAVPNPKMNIDLPSANGTVAASNFTVAGWALDQGATSGAGVDIVQVWAFPLNGSASQFVGTATYGYARPDVAAYAGSGNFTNSGFALGASLPAGTYDLYVFAHSTVSMTFNNVRIVRITAVTPPSTPRMWVDTPSTNATVGQTFTVGGWALDLASSSGPGVAAVHVWAYPAAGGGPQLFGVAQYGANRPDVGSYAGNARFGPSGFAATGTLPVGDYTLAVFALSTVTNTFNNVVLVPVHVR